MAGCTELNNEEKEKLTGLTHLQRCVYVFGIRWYMDSKTRITGIKRGISYQGIAEELYVEPVAGIQDTGSPSRMQIRRAVTALEKSGLIINKSIGKKLILECVLARQSSCVQNKADTRPTQQAGTKEDLRQSMKNINKNKELNHNISLQADTQADIAKIPQADTPPLSNILHNITLHPAHHFFQLLAKQGYYINQLYGNKKTLAMVHAWVKADVSLEEAQIGINHVNHQLGKPPDTPTYYNKPVLQVRTDFKNAQQLAQEMTHDNSVRRPASQSKQFDKRAEAYRQLEDWTEKQQQEN